MSLEYLGDRLDDFEWHKVQTDRPEAPVNGWRFDPSRQVWGRARARTSGPKSRERSTTRRHGGPESERITASKEK
jgi:hypothetical protein